MDIFEKQQTIEAIKTVVKARWFFVTAAVVQVIVLRVIAHHLSFMTFSFLALLAVIIYGFNFFYWVYLKRDPEKISIFGLKTVKVLQIMIDVILISLILYFDRTVTVFAASFYLISVMMASALYKKQGIVLTAIFIGLIYTGLASLEYLGFFPEPSAEVGYLVVTSIKGNLFLLERALIVFYCYLFGASVISGYIAGLFRKREKNLKFQRDELTEKTKILTEQKTELTQTKGWLNAALVKSDRARVELTKAKEELEKVNLELRKKIAELEKFYRVTVDRELKMVELKKEIKNLQETVKKLESRTSKKKSDIV